MHGKNLRKKFNETSCLAFLQFLVCDIKVDQIKHRSEIVHIVTRKMSTGIGLVPSEFNAYLKYIMRKHPIPRVFPV